jgi:hypothetical protein
VDPICLLRGEGEIGPNDAQSPGVLLARFGVDVPYSKGQSEVGDGVALNTVSHLDGFAAEEVDQLDDEDNDDH